MILTLTIENEESLPNGAPTSLKLEGKRGIDIGRGAQMDWPLPDPTRFISSKHCEIRFREDAYWLYDVSTNGTFLNDSSRRLQAPHLLTDGDRLAVGAYVILVKLEVEEEEEPTLAWAEQEGLANGHEAWPLPPQNVSRETFEEETSPGPADQPVELPKTPEPEPAPGLDEFLRRFAKGAGIPETILAKNDPLQLAEDLGALMQMTTDGLCQLLSARIKAKRYARSGSQTMIQAFDNNPLKFAPTPQDALKIMFGPRTSGYLDAKRALEGAFGDLKSHQIRTFSAMQHALRMLLEDLDPQTIDAATEEDKGLASLFYTRKTRLWDVYKARWDAKAMRHDDGLVDAFMLYFADCYDDVPLMNEDEKRAGKG